MPQYSGKNACVLTIVNQCILKNLRNNSHKTPSHSFKQHLQTISTTPANNVGLSNILDSVKQELSRREET